MSIEWFRDLVMSVFGIGAGLAVIFIAVLMFLLYRRVKPILDSVRTAARSVENVATTVETEVARPLAQVAALVHGVRQAINMVSRFTGRKEEDKDE
ncbi:MAG: hypothetical protein ABID71_03250 [Chloroflexota bacterium]